MSSSKGAFIKGVLRSPLREVQNELPVMPQQPSKSKASVHPGAAAPREVDSTWNCDSTAQWVGNSNSELQQKQDTPEMELRSPHSESNGLVPEIDITFKSFTCLDGECQLSDTLNSAEVTQDLPLVNPSSSAVGVDCEPAEASQESSPHKSPHLEHPYCQASPSAILAETPLISQDSPCLSHWSALEPPETDHCAASGIVDLTLRSFICTSVEVEVSGSPDTTSEISALLKNLHFEERHADVSQSNETCCEDQDAFSSSQHIDHPYWNMDNCSVTYPIVNSACEVSQSPLQGGYVLETSTPHPGHNGDITLKSFMCLGGEVQIVEDASTLLEKSSVIELGAVKETSRTSDSSVSFHNGEASVVTCPGDHMDHPYCDMPKSVKELSQHASCVDISRHEEEVEDEECNDAPAVLESAQPGTMHGEDAEEHFQSRNASGCIMNGAMNNSAPVTEDTTTAQATSSQHALPEHSRGGFGCAKGPCNSSLQSEEADCEEMRQEMCVSAQAVELLSANSQELSHPCTPRASILSKSLLLESQTDQHNSQLWDEALDSPLPPPCLNSTALPSRLLCLSSPPSPLPQAPGMASIEPVPQQDSAVVSGPAGQALNHAALLESGPLQDQLRQVAELLMAASGRFVDQPTAPPPPATFNQQHVAVATTPVRCHSVCIGTSPQQQEFVERSVNTSALQEVEVQVSDACTSTDSLHLNLNAGCLASLSREELEQRLTSYLIMTEALLQQLACAHAQTRSLCPAPSDLRNKLIQTDHTELSQRETYKDLYVIALDKIESLQMDLNELQDLHQNLQAMSLNMVAVKTETEDALSSMRAIGDTVTADQQDMSKQVFQMRKLYGKCRESLKKMQLKTRDCLQQKDEMRQRMEDALQAEEAAISVTQQLREHCAARVAVLEENVGSHQQLLEALAHSCPLQATLNRNYVETLSEAKELLSSTLEEQNQLQQELDKARCLLQRNKPILRQLHQVALSAKEQSELHQADTQQAMEDRAQIQQELEQTQTSLQDANQLVGDLNTQHTILTTEMQVLRQQLGEMEEECERLQKCNAELSATVTSTLASYAFLEQALDGEKKRMQHSIQETQEANERASGLEEALDMSRLEVQELVEALAQRDGLVEDLQAQAQTYEAQLHHLHKLRAELSSSKEMNEFLQMENELTREQMSESEAQLRLHLQSLRERNLECEDLKLDLAQLRLDHDTLQAELTRAEARHQRQEEQMSQASNQVTLLHHHIHCFNSTLKHALAAKMSEPSSEEEPQESSLNTSSETAGGMESPTAVFASSRSAFSRVPVITPKKQQEQENSVVQVVTEMTGMFSKLTDTINRLQQHQDNEQEQLHKAKEALQAEVEEERRRYQEQRQELNEQLQHLQAQVEKDGTALQQKAEDEKALTKLSSEMDKNMEQTQKYRAENIELRREAAELRLALKQSQVEVQFLREELSRTNGPTTPNTKATEEKIRLLKEVEELKQTLSEVEESKAKLLERAKRHQTVHMINQSKLEKELHLLDDMIENVRKTLSSVPHVVTSCIELQELVAFLG